MYLLPYFTIKMQMSDVKIESYIKSKDHKDMLKNLLDENDKLKLRTETVQKFDSLNAKLSSENKIDVENASELNEVM